MLALVVMSLRLMVAAMTAWLQMVLSNYLPFLFVSAAKVRFGCRTNHVLLAGVGVGMGVVLAYVRLPWTTVAQAEGMEEAAWVQLQPHFLEPRRRHRINLVPIHFFLVSLHLTFHFRPVQAPVAFDSSASIDACYDCIHVFVDLK